MSTGNDVAGTAGGQWRLGGVFIAFTYLKPFFS